MESSRRGGRRQVIQAGLSLAGLGLLAGCSALTSLPSRQRPIPRLGFLSPNDAGSLPTTDAFLDGLHDLGYVEGQTISIDWRYADGQDDRLEQLAEELILLKPDVIVTFARGITAVRQITSTIPIVSATTGDLVYSGLASSLARPGGNVTGLITLAPQLAGKRLELMKEVFPHASRVGALWNPQEQWMTLEIGAARQAAQSLGVDLASFEVRDAREIDRAFDDALSARIDVLLPVFTSFFVRNRARLVERSTASRLPTISGDPDFARAGGLLAYGPNGVDLYRRAAHYVDKIIKGASPAELPIEQPTRFDLVVNVKSAMAIGLAIPPSVLQQATEVIQ